MSLIFPQNSLKLFLVLSTQKLIILSIISLIISQLAFVSSTETENDDESSNSTVPLNINVRRGPMVNMKVFDPETNKTTVWDAYNGTSVVDGNIIKVLKESAESSESTEKVDGNEIKVPKNETDSSSSSSEEKKKSEN